MENNKENKKIVINGKQYYNLEEVPEEFRAMIQENMNAAKTGRQMPYETKTNIQKDFQFQFQAGTGLTELLKLLIKVSQPPKPRAKEQLDPTPIEPDPEEEAEPSTDTLPRPEAIEPSSSGWIVWLMVFILAACYFLYSRMGVR
jgi:hypothetical protein